MTKIFRGADGTAFAAMTTKVFEFSRALAKDEGMDLGMVVLGDTATNPPAAVVLDMPPGCELPRHAHNTRRMELAVRGPIMPTAGGEVRSGGVSHPGSAAFNGHVSCGR